MTVDDPLPPDELAPRLAEVHLLVGLLYRRALRKVKLGEEIEGVGAGVRAVLDMLRLNGPMTVPQMGRAQALSRQFVQRMVNDAAGLGHVEAVPNPAHRRSSLIQLTDDGRAAIGAVIAREHGLLGQIGGGLTQADVDGCVKVLSMRLDTLSDVDMD
ncbi:DNA-binding MarR family transcriptional regulator [Catenulispora sp. EB89]|uniref:MarR family winged helix-turn-helix transcriptional regulator n=1 Tax=Catenulispora sp. EB89 TaxID=3156257 RepID=UPI0035141B26